MLYRLCDLVVQSNVPLPELLPASQTIADLDFEMLPPGDLQEVTAEWFHQRNSSNGEVWRAFSPLAGGYLLRFPRFADFSLLDDARKLLCRPRSAVPEMTLRHLLIDQVLPFVFCERGYLVLHASAVGTPGGALAFVGQSGRGKSTLAASFCHRGYRLLTDDFLVLKEIGHDFVVFPTYPGLRLYPPTLAVLFEDALDLKSVAHYTSKKRVGPRDTPLAFNFEPLPLRRILFLDPFADGISAKTNTISKSEAFFELTRSALSLDSRSAKNLKAGFFGCNRLAGFSSLYRIAIPKGFSVLPKVCDEILGLR